MSKPQPQTTVPDHPFNPASHGQILIGSIVSQWLSMDLVEQAQSHTHAHPDCRCALLQRAAAIANGSTRVLHDAHQQAPREQHYLFDASYDRAFATILSIVAARASIPAPASNEPDHSALRYTGHPAPVDPDVNRYWKWLQAHVQTMPLNRWLEDVSDHIASEQPGTDTHSDALASAAHAVSAVRHPAGTDLRKSVLDRARHADEFRPEEHPHATLNDLRV